MLDFMDLDGIFFFAVHIRTGLSMALCMTILDPDDAAVVPLQDMDISMTYEYY